MSSTGPSIDNPARPSLTSRERVLSLAAIALLFLIVFGTALRAQFYVIEDHLLLVGLDWGISDWLARIRGDIAAFQRVRPGYWIYIAVAGRAFGANPHLWHAATIAWGVLSSYFFYLALRGLGADRLSGTVFVLLFVLGASHNWVWMNLIPQETTGMALAAIAVWSIVDAAGRPRPAPWDALAVIALAFAGLIKESFIVLIPALIGLRLACIVNRSDRTWREALREAKVFVVGGLVVFAVELGVVAFVVLSKPAGYSATASGMSLSSLSPIRLFQMLGTWDTAGVVVLLVAVCGVMWFDRRVRRDLLVAAAAVLGLWLAPQVVLYSNGLQERYLLPSIAGVDGAFALATAYLLRQRWLRVFGWLGIVAVLPIIARGAGATSARVAGFTAETVSVHSAIDFLAENVTSSKAILIVADSGTPYGFEATHSVPKFLRHAGAQSPVYLWPIVSRGERSPMHLAASQNNTAFKYPDSLAPQHVGGIIVLDKWIPSFDPEPLSDWLGATVWREVVFREPYSGLSIRPLVYREIGEVNHRVLLPADSSSSPGAKPLVSVDAALAGVVRVGALFDPPPWGLENDYAGPGSIVWLGQGDTEGLGWELSSTVQQFVELVFEVVPGPSAPGTSRTIELEIKRNGAPHVQRTTVDGGQWRLPLTLLPGANHFRVRVLDAATVLVQPNGDTRRLMALVRGISVRAPSAR